jgi:hypothetical protein
LVGEQASIWLLKESLTITCAQEPLAEYAVTYTADRREFATVSKVHLFPSSAPSPQARLWDAQAMSEIEWRTVIKLPPYRRHRASKDSLEYLQGTLFA